MKNWLTSLPGKVLSFFRWVISPAGRKLAEARFQTAIALADKYYPHIKRLAELTPTKADDELVKAAAYFGIDGDPATPFTARGIITALMAKREAASIPGHILNAAVEIAYVVFRAEQDSDSNGALAKAA